MMKDILGYEGRYQIDEFGKVYRIARTTIQGHKLLPSVMKQTMTTTGYPAVSLHNENGQKICRIHRLLAKAFIPNPENKKDINHKNGIKTDFRLENLEWATRSENIQHSYDVLKRKVVDGALHGKSKILLDLETGIFYDSIKFAAIAKCVTREKMKSSLYWNGRFGSILYA